MNEWRPPYWTAHVKPSISGSSSVSVLPQDPEEVAATLARKRPIGFDPPAEKPATKRKRKRGS